MFVIGKPRVKKIYRVMVTFLISGQDSDKKQHLSNEEKSITL